MYYVAGYYPIQAHKADGTLEEFWTYKKAAAWLIGEILDSSLNGAQKMALIRVIQKAKKQGQPFDYSMGGCTWYIDLVPEPTAEAA